MSRTCFAALVNGLKLPAWASAVALRAGGSPKLFGDMRTGQQAAVSILI